MTKRLLITIVSLLVAQATLAQTPVGSEFQVNTFTSNFQYDTAAAAAADGDFVVVWTSSVVGSQFEVNSFTMSHQRSPAVATAGNGDFVVVWESTGSPGDDTAFDSVQGQRYASDGTVVGSQFQVNSYTTSSQGRPAIAAAGNDDFVVVWESFGSPGDDTSGFSIQMQRYTSDGSAIGSELQVNSYTTNGQDGPAVTAAGNGDFVVVWESSGSPGDDTATDSVQGQRYASDGSAIGSQFQINSYTTGRQEYPAVTAEASGDFVVVWESAGSAGSDTSGGSVQGQRFVKATTGDIGDKVWLDENFDGLQAGPSLGSQVFASTCTTPDSLWSTRWIPISWESLFFPTTLSATTPSNSKSHRPISLPLRTSVATIPPIATSIRPPPRRSLFPWNAPTSAGTPA